MMHYFLETTHLSEIMEASDKEPVIIFKYSSECGSSDRLLTKLEKSIKEKSLKAPVYKVTVQIHKALSAKIAEMFEVKHQSPQILILNKGKLTYTAHHNSIKIEEFVIG